VGRTIDIEAYSSWRLGRTNVRYQSAPRGGAPLSRLGDVETYQRISASEPKKQSREILKLMLQDELVSLFNEQQYDAMLKKIEEVVSEGIIHPSLLVFKSMAIRQTDDTSRYTLDDAKSALYQALDMDKKYVDALTELGWSYLNLEDDAKQAIVFFQRAVNISRAQFVESVGGVARCMAEIGPNQAAVQYYTDNVTGLVEKEEMDKEIEEIQEIIRFD
jgi:tetratricopeptide (TPR) repeat protein